MKQHASVYSAMLQLGLAPSGAHTVAINGVKDRLALLLGGHNAQCSHLFAEHAEWDTVQRVSKHMVRLAKLVLGTCHIAIANQPTNCKVSPQGSSMAS